MFDLGWLPPREPGLAAADTILLPGDWRTALETGQSGDPLHGITLEMMLQHLVARFGWETLGSLIDIRCFTHEPSIKSSLKFLRKTPWARAKVEALYVRSRQAAGSRRGGAGERRD